MKVFANHSQMFSSVRQFMGSHKGSFLLIGYLVIACIAYSGVAFFQVSLKWDMVDCYLPWRYFVGESIQNGIFPLWNPYQHLGYPIYADMRSVFYPEAIMIGLLGGYSIYTLHLLFIGYLALAAFGMYRLAGNFTNNQLAQWLAGLVYMLSGFFVSHGQEMFGIIAATWIPYILHYFLRLLNHRKWPDMWHTSFFLFLQLSGGYQALSIMLFYLMLILFLATVIGDMLHKRWLELVRLIMLQSGLVISVILLSAVIIITFIQVSPYIGRFGGISLADAEFMPFSPQSLISLLLPFAAVKDPAFYDTDLSMNNAYVGLAVLMLYLISWVKKKNTLEIIFGLFGLICLLAAFGKYTPVRQWFYDYLPLMNLFRMSAFFRYFAIVSFILLGTAELSKLWQNPEQYHQKLLVLAAAFAVVIIVQITQAVPHIDFYSLQMCDFIFNLKQALVSSTRSEHVFFQGIIQVIFLGIFVAGVFLYKRRSSALALFFIFFTIAEMTIAVKLNFFVTVASDPRPASISKVLNKMPEGFPLPDLGVAAAKYRDSKPGLQPLWRNTNIFTKTVSAEGFNSFRLNGFETLQRDYPELFENSIKNPVAFLSSIIRPFSTYHPDSLGDPKKLWIADSVFDRISHQMFPCSPGDTIAIMKFYPNQILCKVEINSPKALTVLQTNFPDWNAYLNGEPIDHFTSNNLFISCIVPEGENSIEFRYENKPVMAGFYFSSFAFFLTIAVILFNLLKKQSPKRAFTFLIIILFALLLAVFLLIQHLKSSDQKQLLAYRKLTQQMNRHMPAPDSTLLVLNVDNPDRMKEFLTNYPYKIYFQRFSQKSDILKLDEFIYASIKSNQFHTLIYGRYNLPDEPEAEEIIRSYFPDEQNTVNDGRILFKVFKNQPRRLPLFRSVNDFERSYHFWVGDTTKRDETKCFDGGFSWRLNTNQPGSPAMEARFEELGATGNLRIVAQAKVFLEQNADAALYIVIERNEKSVWQTSVGASEFFINKNIWRKVLLVGEPDFEILPTDRLKAFFWINGQENLWIDDFDIRIYSLPG